MINQTKIPVGVIISRVFSSVRNNAFALLRLSLPVIVIGLLSTLYYGTYKPNTELFGDFTLEGLVLMVLSIAAYAMAIIGIHRVFILSPEIVTHTSTFRWTSRESDWLLWTIALLFWVILLTVVPSCVAISSLPEKTSDLEQSVAIANGIGWVVGLFIGYFIARWSLIFPSIATDGNIKSLSDSWERSKGNVFRLFILIGIIPMVTSWFISFLPTDRTIFFSIAVQVLGWVVAVLEIGLLSHSYTFLTDNKNSEKATSALD